MVVRFLHKQEATDAGSGGIGHISSEFSFDYGGFGNMSSRALLCLAYRSFFAASGQYEDQSELCTTVGLGWCDHCRF